MDLTTLLHEVNEAFKQCASMLALSRSALAASPLVTPALVLDDVAPTADDRGRALRIVLQWAVEQLAPTPARFPIGEFRPWDDPSWREPAWWRYNILRHRYLEPLGPDDFVEGGRITETLMALTGIPSVDMLFDERNRAMRAVADHLLHEWESGAATGELQRLALRVALRPLAMRTDATNLLAIAAALGDVFPRALLLEMAAAEGVARVAAALDALIQYRFLLAGDEGANLWISTPLRDYLIQHTPPATVTARHARAAHLLQARGESLAAARHWLQAGGFRQAADILLDDQAEAASGYTPALQRELLQAIPSGKLATPTWLAIQIQLSDLCAAAGATDAAIAACRTAIKISLVPNDQARIYRRLGKLYEQRNQMHALNYYRQAEERFSLTDPELATLLKDRGWLHILRKEWPAAATDLDRALALAPAHQSQSRADILDALASLYRHQGQHAASIDYAQKSLSLREESGDLLRVAKSLGNLGLLYSSTDDFTHAAAAHREAMAIYQRLGNRELMATAWLNLGTTQHLAGERTEALAAYRTCLTLCQEVNLPLAEVRVLYNLAEVQAELGAIDGAQLCWQQGFELAHLYGFADQVTYFRTLAAEYPSLAAAAPLPFDPLLAEQPITPPSLLSRPTPALEPEARIALELAQRLGQVTPRALMVAASVSKATATRRLAELVTHGVLVKCGQGRSTCYTAAATDGTPTQSERVAAITARLQQLHDVIAERFGVAGFAQVDSPPSTECVRLSVRFTRIPDLKTFFALEQQLALLLGVPVDLVPADLPAKTQLF